MTNWALGLQYFNLSPSGALISQSASVDTASFQEFSCTAHVQKYYIWNIRHGIILTVFFFKCLILKETWLSLTPTASHWKLQLKLSPMISKMSHSETQYCYSCGIPDFAFHVWPSSSSQEPDGHRQPRLKSRGTKIHKQRTVTFPGTSYLAIRMSQMPPLPYHSPLTSY